MIYDILEGKLVAQGFVAGSDLFRYTIPANVNSAVMFKLPLSGVPVDHNMPGWHSAEIQVVCRDPDPVACMNTALRVQKILTVETIEVYPASAERGQAHITNFLPMQLPVIFPRLDSNLFETSQNFLAHFGFKPL